jgi:hypothetical protein
MKSRGARVAWKAVIMIIFVGVISAAGSLARALERSQRREKHWKNM